MELFSYLFKFIFFDIHKRLVITLYRSSILLSHRFGIAVMIKSLFKPLFGMNNFLSRINGFVIRSLSIVLGSLIIILYLCIGVIGYIGVFFLLFKFAVTTPIYAILFLVFVLLCGLYNYYFYNKVTISGNTFISSWQVNITYQSIINGNIKYLSDSFQKSTEVKELLIRSELPFEDTFKFIDLNRENFNLEKFNELISEFIGKGAFKDKRFRVVDLFCAYLLQFQSIDSHLDKYRIDKDLVINALGMLHYIKALEPRVWDIDFNIPPAGGIDKGWAISYTPNINRVGTDLTKAALQGGLPQLLGREDIKNQIISVLSKPSSNNVLLYGDAGSGKTTFIKALAREIATGTSIPALRHKRIISIDVGALTSGKSSDVSKIVSQIAKEAETAGNIIMFIDEIQSLSSISSSDPNASPVFAVLEPYLSSAKFQFIGTTSYDNYLKYIRPNESFARTFDLVELRETTPEETIALMEDYSKVIEYSRKFKFTYPALKVAYDSSKKYVYDRALPDKALSLLNQAYADKKDNNILTRKDILDFISNRFHIPVNSVDANEKEILLNIEDIMKKKIIGQDQAITLIAKALKRARAGIRNENKPIASFMFSGPTGVGKTETAKVLAESYFGNKDRIIRIDMSEYQSVDSLNRLIGDSNGQVGYLISKIQAAPHSLILLDEIEKADKNILNLFLQVLDDGRLTSASGKTYDFTNTFIIMTTNVGTKAITQAMSSGATISDITSVALAELKAYFPIEFLNRFTSIIPYSPLTKENLFEITNIKLDQLKRKVAEKKIKIEFSDGAIRQVGEMAYSPEWGARELNRIIEDKVETLIAEKMISGEINSGDTYKFDMIQ